MYIYIYICIYTHIHTYTCIYTYTQAYFAHTPGLIVVVPRSPLQVYTRKRDTYTRKRDIHTRKKRPVYS